jgi:hypothetical protein
MCRALNISIGGMVKKKQVNIELESEIISIHKKKQKPLWNQKNQKKIS